MVERLVRILTPQEFEADGRGFQIVGRDGEMFIVTSLPEANGSGPEVLENSTRPSQLTKGASSYVPLKGIRKRSEVNFDLE